MQALPHKYLVSAKSSHHQTVMLSANGLQQLETDAPAEFGGPGDLWSPETMLAGAIANCFILSFRALAKHSNFIWTTIDCDVEAVLDREERVTRFTQINLNTRLVLPSESDQLAADKLLDKAKSICLITNSMSASVELTKNVVIN